jgi:hypothetical protein
MRTHTRHQHLETFQDRLVAQKFCLAALHLRLRGMLDAALVMENGEHFDEVLARAAEYVQLGTCLRGRDGRTYSLQRYADMFPPHAYLVREHTLSLPALRAAVDEAATQVRLPRDVIADYGDMCEELYRQSKSVHDFRQQQPNDRKLFRSCFGFFPQGHVQVIQGALSLHFRVYALEDYAKAFAGERNGKQADSAQLKRAGRMGGAALFCGRIPRPVRNAVSLEQNDDKQLFVGERVGVFRHEQDHIFHQFFRAPWMHTTSQFPRRRYSRIDPDDMRGFYRALLEDAVDVSRTLRVVSRAKDELLAKFNSGNSLPEIRESMLELGSEALYDFAGQEHEDIRATGALRAAPRVVGPLVRDRLHGAYSLTLQHALHALRMLEQSGIERVFISELLRIEPMEKWPRLARMALERL